MSIDAKKLFYILSGIFLTITLLYAVKDISGLRNTAKSLASTPVGYIKGICSNQTVRGNIYVTFETYNSRVSSVDFYIDNAPKLSTEVRYPFALNGNQEDGVGTIFPYDTRQLSDGEHTVK
ncbi:MAG: hypothetical protein M3P33_03905, partial [bacterium]|nr:hypothetical protein [bacterium]